MASPGRQSSQKCSRPVKCTCEHGAHAAFSGVVLVDHGLALLCIKHACAKHGDCAKMCSLLVPVTVRLHPAPGPLMLFRAVSL